MRALGNIGKSPLYNSTQGIGSLSSTNSSSAIAAFHKPSGTSGLAASRGSIGLATPSLSSQTTSTLMQEQDITQLEEHGHGGGGHGGGMKMMRNIEAESAAGSEETQQMRKRKKLLKPRQIDDVKEDKEVDENGEPRTKDEDKAKIREADEDERSVWSWS